MEDPNAEYDVESVLEARMRKGKLQYLVKWLGYGDEENSWEPAENLLTAREKVRDFYKKNPGAPRPLTDLAKKFKFQEAFHLNIPNRKGPRKQW